MSGESRINPGKAAVNGQGAGDDVDDDQATDTGTTVKRPLRDLVNRVLGGGAQEQAGADDAVGANDGANDKGGANDGANDESGANDEGGTG